MPDESRSLPWWCKILGTPVAAIALPGITREIKIKVEATKNTLLRKHREKYCDVFLKKKCIDVLRICPPYTMYIL